MHKKTSKNVMTIIFVVRIKKWRKHIAQGQF